MVEINGTTIKLTRGNTLRLGLELDRPLEEGEEIKYGFKESYDDTECLIEKTILAGDDVAMYLAPSDTKELPYGTYVWDAKIIYANGDVYTFITEAKLKLTKDVV